MTDQPDKETQPTVASEEGSASNSFVSSDFASSQTSESERRRAFQTLFISLICVGMGQSLIFTILPPLSRQIGLSEAQVSSIFAVSAIVWIFSSPYWGRKSDIWGRKPVILFGLVAYAVSLGMFATAIVVAQKGWLPMGVTFVIMILTRTVYGVFGSGTMPAASAYVADRTTPENRAAGMGMLGAAFGVGTMLGPGVGGILVYFGLLAPLYFAAFLAVISAILVWRILPERTRPTIKPGEVARIAITDSRVWPFVFFGVMLSTGQALMAQTAAFYFMDKLHLEPTSSAQYVGVAMMASAMSGLFVQLGIIQRFQLTARFLMRVGIGGAILGNALFVIAPNYGTLVFAMVMLGGSFGMARPGFSAAASLAVKPEEQGSVAGLLGSTGASGHVVAPLLVAVLYGGLGPSSVYIFNTILMSGLLAFVFWHPALRELRVGSPEESNRQADQADTVIPKG